MPSPRPLPHAELAAPQIAVPSAAARFAPASWISGAAAAAIVVSALAFGYVSAPSAREEVRDLPERTQSAHLPVAAAVDDASLVREIPVATGTAFGVAGEAKAAPPFSAQPAWSPDGSTVAFAKPEPDRPGILNIWLMNVSTSETRRLTSFRYGQTGSASWFPDSRRLAYPHEDRLVIRDIGANSTREIASPVPNRQVRAPAVSPDGRLVIFQVTGSGAWLLDVAAGVTRLAIADPGAEAFAWSPDGRRITYYSRRDTQWRMFQLPPAASPRVHG